MKAFYSSAILACVFFVSIVSFQNSYAQKKNQSDFNIKPFERKAFIENKGQFNSQLPINKNNFSYCIDRGYQVFFYNNSLTYRLQKITHRKEKLRDVLKSEEKREELEHEMNKEEQFIHVEWLNANPNATIEVSEKSTTIYSYLLKDKNQNNYTEMCQGYSRLTYKNLYNGIDVEYIFHPTEGIKYNIIASVGADLSQIKLKYTGQKNISISNGEIHIKTIIGDIIEKQPLSYHSNNSSITIPSSYNLQNNILSFNVHNSSTDNITIDPWVVIPGTIGSVAYDNGTDALGNNYIYGGSLGSFTVEKYASTGGAALWSFASSSVVNNSYYGDMLVESSGNFYLCEGYVGGGAHTYKFSPSSSIIWASNSNGNFREHWRLALDCKTGRVIVAGGGTTSPTLNIAEINLATGTLINAKSVYSGSQSDVAGLCVDGTGKSYLKHSNPNIVTFTDNANNALANVGDGYALSEVGIGGNPSYYPSNFANGYNMMALAGTSFLFTCDGATIKKWNCATFALIGSVTIPGAAVGLGSGILIDECNNLFVGTNIGVFRYNFNLVQQEFHAAPAAVYDIAFSPSGQIIASGNGFLTNIIFNTPPCLFQTAPISKSSCGGGATGFIKLNLTGGVVPYNYVWSGNGLVANTDSVGGLAPGTYKCVFSDTPCNNPHKDSITITILALPIPTASFSANPVCLTSATSFTNSSTVAAPGTITAWAWDFDNNGITDNTSQNPTTTYTAIGTYTVKLKATSNNGCTDSTLASVVVNINPTATFTPIDACMRANVLLNNASTIALPDNINSYSWLFGADSSPLTSLNQNPSSLTYSTSGIKTITLSVTSNHNCTSSITQTVTINPLPQPAFTFTNACINAQPLSFDASSSTIGIGSDTLYAWAFGDGAVATGSVYTHSYTLPSTYNVTLTVTSDKGCQAMIAQQIEVYQKPLMQIAIQSTCLGGATSFTAISLANSGNVTSWLWDVNNTINTIETTNQQSAYAFASAGSQTLHLISITNHNCRDTTTRLTYVNYNPDPQFNVDKPNGCPLPHCVKFTDNSPPVPLPSHINNWAWDFGNGKTVSSATNSPQNNCYTNSSSSQLALFTVTLTTTTDSGCVASNIKPNFITVYPKPIANYTIVPEFGDVVVPLVHFINQSVDYTKWNWSFGDGPKNDTVNVNPNHYYPGNDASSYHSILIVANQYGCTDTANVLVEIAPEFSFYIPNAFTPNADNINDIFTGMGVGIAIYEMWIFDRWGASIFYTDDITKGWNGRVQGKSEDAKEDVYTWKVKLKDVLGKKHEYIGHVTLLK